VKNNSGGYTRNALNGQRDNGANNVAGRAQLQWKPTENLTILANVHGGSVANRPAEYRHLGDLDPATVIAPAGVVPFGGVQCSVAQTDAGQCVDMFGYGTPKNFYGGAFNRTQHLQVHNWGGSLRADWIVNDLLPQPIIFTSLSAFEHNDKLHPEDSDASPNRLLEINFGVRSETFTQEFRATQTGDTYNWVFGLYYLGENLHQNQPLFLFQDADIFFDPFTGVPGSGDGIAEIANDHSRQITNSYAAFGQGSWEFAPKFKLTFGARFTGESKSFQYAQDVQVQSGGINNYTPPIPTVPPPGESFNKKLSNDAFNWRGALDYQATDAIMAYASIATGFKSGGFNGSFLGNLPFPDPNQVNAQLQPIAPEKVRTYEVGVKSSFFDDHLQVDAAAFYNDYRNLQIFILSPIPAPPPINFILVNILSNAKKAHMEGLDLSVIGKPMDNLTLSAQLGLLQSKIDSNEQIGVDALGNPTFDHGKQTPISPHVTLSTLADYRVPLEEGALDFQLSANYKSFQFFDLSNDPYTTQRPYWIENARIGYSFDDDQWEVAAFIRNLSGQHYLVDAFDLTAPFGLIQGIMGAPRTYGAELNFNF
jgi:iron complex outermembrane receptor protein